MADVTNVRNNIKYILIFEDPMKYRKKGFCNTNTIIIFKYQ